MIDLISHIVKISSCRDRTEINAAVVDTLVSLFHPLSVTIFRCYSSKKKTILFACASYRAEARIIRNAYLPDHQHCRPIERDPLLNRCRKELSAVLDVQEDGSHRIVFPITRMDQPIYMLDITLPDSFSADKRITLMGLIEYFGNHIGLLDYGESDTLTGLASRKTFDKHLFELLGNSTADELLRGFMTPRTARRRGNNNGDTHWLAVCDIDHFKSVNDNFGHLIGDEVLIMVSQMMQHSFRFDDQLFRFGGEEFVALLQPTDETSAMATLERFRANIEQQTFSRVGHITISIGFSLLRENDTPTDVIDRADDALYFAKRHGRNRVCSYENLIASGQLTAHDLSKGEVEFF
ncbi:MAG: GGDEF domain-containing protein [Rhodocyclales bacterium GT-UBC]|nr:MAG: GGDEF domain-containing protein [Rhodocyclales bacterium GT-UBC]